MPNRGDRPRLRSARLPQEYATSKGKMGRQCREHQRPAFGSGNRGVGLHPLNVLRCMNGHDVVQVNETVMATPDLEDEPIEIKAGWRGTIIGHADKPMPCILLDESYRGKPFI